MQQSYNPEKTYGSGAFCQVLSEDKTKRSLNGLGCSAFARHYSRNLCEAHCFLFLRLLRCFSSPGYSLTSLYIQLAGPRSSIGEVPPFGNPRIKGCLPPNRGLSQAATSFIIFLCQGIHHILLRDFPTFLILN
jgi:hypothetical protein